MKEIRTIAIVSPFALVNPFMEFHVSFYEKNLVLIYKKPKDLLDIRNFNIPCFPLSFAGFLGFLWRPYAGDQWSRFYLVAFWPLVKTHHQFLAPLSNIEYLTDILSLSSESF